MSSIPPKQLDEAEVLLYTSIDRKHEATAGCRHTVGGELMGSAAGLAVCRYAQEDSGYYLFYCDEDWNVLTDGWHETLEGAKDQAEFKYKGVTTTWQKAEQ